MKQIYVQHPVPHLLRFSKKQIHGWWHGLEPYGRRDCTAERLLLNPYNGCQHGCFFCYARAYWKDRDALVVFRDFDRHVAEQLDRLSVASCGYLSPVTDPFQPIDAHYHLSENLIRVFLERNIPIEFVTKGELSWEILELMRTQRHSFGQVSILTLREELRRIFVPGGAPTPVLFRNLEMMASLGIFAVCRLDPVFPYVNDDVEEMEALLSKAAKSGARHVVASCLDIPLFCLSEILDGIDRIEPGLSERYKVLYTERLGSYLHADITYRHRLFSLLRGICQRLGLTFALCMEFAIGCSGRHASCEGLNRYFMTSLNCEGVDVPLYIRDGTKFRPVSGCRGACLGCGAPSCDIEDLPRAGAWKLQDYLRWSGKL